MCNRIQVIQDCIDYLVHTRDDTFTSYSALRGFDIAIEDLRTFKIDELEREKQEYDDDVDDYYHDKYAEPVGDYKYSF